MSVGAVVSQKYVMPRTNAAGKPCTIILRSKEYTTSQHGAVLAGRGNYPGQLALHGVFGMESACIEQGNDCDMLKHNQSNLPSPATMHSPNEATTSLTRPIGTRRKHGQQQNGAVQAWDARRGFNEGKKKKKRAKKGTRLLRRHSQRAPLRVCGEQTNDGGLVPAEAVPGSPTSHSSPSRLAELLGIKVLLW